MGAGTVFKIPTDGSGFSTLHAFRGEDGRGSWAGLTLGNDGALYDHGGGGTLWWRRPLSLEDDDGIQFGAPVFTSRGPSSRAVVTVTRKAGLSESITVDFATSDGSAREGLDTRQLRNGLLRAGPGHEDAHGPGLARLHVPRRPSLRDGLVQSSGRGAPASGSSNTAVVSLVDTKPVPRIQFGKATYTGIEGATAFRVSVLRSGPTDAPVTVDFSTGDGSATGPEIRSR